MADDKHNSEEVEGFLHAASVSVISVPSCYSIRDRPVRGSVAHQAERVRLQLPTHSSGVLCLNGSINNSFMIPNAGCACVLTLDRHL